MNQKSISKSFEAEVTIRNIVRKKTLDMGVDSFTRRILFLHEHKSVLRYEPQKLLQQRYQVKNKKMNMATMRTSNFAWFNDKRFYFYDGIASLPFSHEFRCYKGESEKKMKKLIVEKNLIRCGRKINWFWKTKDYVFWGLSYCSCNHIIIVGNGLFYDNQKNSNKIFFIVTKSFILISILYILEFSLYFKD